MTGQCPKDWRPRPLDQRCLSVEFGGRHRCFLDINHKPPCNCACGTDRFTLTPEVTHDTEIGPA